MLDDGIRWLDLLVDYCTPGSSSGTLCLCRGNDTCAVHSTPLVARLEEIAAWMQANPNEIVTLLLEEYVDDDDLANAVEEAGLGSSTYPRTPTSEGLVPFPWTLHNMVNKGARLVIFGGPYLPRSLLFIANSPTLTATTNTASGDLWDWSTKRAHWCSDASGQLPAEDFEGLFVKESVAQNFAETTSWSLAACISLQELPRR